MPAKWDMQRFDALPSSARCSTSRTGMHKAQTHQADLLCSVNVHDRLLIHRAIIPDHVGIFWELQTDGAFSELASTLPRPLLSISTRLH